MVKPLTTWIPDELAEKFNQICEQGGCSKSDRLRQLVLKDIDDAMKKETTPIEKIVIKENKAVDNSEKDEWDDFFGEDNSNDNIDEKLDEFSDEIIRKLDRIEDKIKSIDERNSRNTIGRCPNTIRKCQWEH